MASNLTYTFGGLSEALAENNEKNSILTKQKARRDAPGFFLFFFTST
jgi:hypothetical protein